MSPGSYVFMLNTMRKTSVKNKFATCVFGGPAWK